MKELIKFDKKKNKFTIIQISKLDQRFYDVKSEYERNKARDNRSNGEVELIELIKTKT